MGTFEAILFDLDGTLLDTMKLITSSYRTTIFHFTGKWVEEADIAKLVGTSVHHILQSFGVTPSEETIGFYKSTYVQQHDQLVRLFPGVAEAVTALQAAPVKLAIVTSKIKGLAVLGLEAFSLATAFRELVAMEDSERHKPHPDPVLVACERLGVSERSRVLMVGDSPFDLQCAQRAGVKTAVVTWSDFPLDVLLAERPDYVIRDMQELVALQQGTFTQFM